MLLGDIRAIHKERNDGIESYELVNPLPVPLLNGILDINKFIVDCNETDYLSILKKVNPDIIHIHTLMGLHKQALNAAKRLNIRIVYTSHDYFGLCTKVNMVDYTGKLCEAWNSEKCSICNQGALSVNKIKILQSVLYRGLKETAFLKKMRRI